MNHEAQPPMRALRVSDNYAYYEQRFGEKLVYSREEEGLWRDAALAVIRKFEIPVNDLYSLVKPSLDTYQQPDDLHFNREGSRAMARQIAGVIRPLLLRGSADP